MPAPRVVDGRRGLGRDLADPRAQLGVDRGRGRLLDQLLVAALDRAVALAEVDDVAVRVGEHLDLDVARVGQVALEVDGRVGEELLALARGALEGVLELVLAERDAEALAAAAARRLDRDRVADRLRRSACGRPRRVSTGSVVPGTIGTPAFAISSRARVLEPIASIADAGGPMNVDAALLERRGEAGVLGQEAVAGVHGLGAGALDRLEQLVDRSGSSRGGARAEQVGLVGALHVQRVAVELGVDGDGRDPELLEARMTRTAISPRLAIRTFENMAAGNLQAARSG